MTRTFWHFGLWCSIIILDGNLVPHCYHPIFADLRSANPLGIVPGEIRVSMHHQKTHTYTFGVFFIAGVSFGKPRHLHALCLRETIFSEFEDYNLASQHIHYILNMTYSHTHTCILWVYTNRCVVRGIIKDVRDCESRLLKLLIFQWLCKFHKISNRKFGSTDGPCPRMDHLKL